MGGASPEPELISVVIPVLDTAETLPAQLEALRRQTYGGKWEVIIADNGSTDGTPDLARTWADRIPELRVVDASDRKGQAHARNVGAAAARGDFIAFCDADDVATPGWLEEMAEAARSCDVVGGAVETDALNDPAVRHWRDARLKTGLGMDQNFLPWAMSANMGVHASVFRELSGFNEDYATGEDVEFCWRVQLASHTLCYAPGALIQYRFRGGLWALARQFHAYGVGAARLYRDFHGSGMPRPSKFRVLGAWGWLLVHLFELPVRRRRGIWIRKAAYRWGRLRGSLRYRVFYV